MPGVRGAIALLKETGQVAARRGKRAASGRLVTVPNGTALGRFASANATVVSSSPASIATEEYEGTRCECGTLRQARQSESNL